MILSKERCSALTDEGEERRGGLDGGREQPEEVLGDARGQGGVVEERDHVCKRSSKELVLALLHALGVRCLTPFPPIFL